MSGTSKFWDKAAESYAKSKISDMEGYTHTLERTRSYLGAQERVIVALILPLMRLVGKAPYVKSLTKSELDLMIEAAGFQIVETVGSAKDPSRHYVVARRIERG